MANVTLVQVQTLRGTQGNAAALQVVQTAVATYNATNPKATPHTVVNVPVLPNNTKGMQWQLAMFATLARVHGANMVRLSVHGGAVALCGTPAAIAATQAAMGAAYNQYMALANNAYNAAQHGNRVGFTNAYLCGCPAGVQLAHGITAALAYAIGYLYPFAAPGNGVHYAAGQAAALAVAKPAKPTAKAAKPAKATAQAAPQAAPQPAPQAASAA